MPEHTVRRVLFFTRTAFMNEVSGSGTGVAKVLELLCRAGVEVQVLIVAGYSRSPRLFFRNRVSPPEGVQMDAPGYVRVGQWYVNPFSPRAWAGMVCRLLRRVRLEKAAFRVTRAIFGGSIVLDPWDLTPATKGETRAVCRAVRRWRPTTVIANYAFLGPALCAPGLEETTRIVMMHDLLSARIRQFRKMALPLDCLEVTESEEMGWMQCADYVMAAQGSEAEEIKGKVKGKVLLQPIVIEVQRNGQEPEPRRCLFVGTRILPNVAGMEWFLSEVWPRVLREEPEAELRLAGSICSVITTDAARVTMLGVVPSLDEEIKSATVCVVPLRVGSGIKLKLLEAMAWSKACVSTSIGVQGLEALAPGVIEVSDDAEGFAAGVVRLMRDGALRREREAAAGELMRRHFSMEGDAAQEFVVQVLGGARAGGEA